MTITVQQMLGQAVSLLKEARVDNPTLDARLLVCYALGISHEALVAYPQKKLSDEEKISVEKVIAERAKRRPVSHIIGEREFYGLVFYVNDKVLDPRPDSETLIDAVCGYISDKNQSIRVLDAGVGSGCLLLTILHLYPQARGVGVDISPDALEMAKRNTEKLMLASRVDFRLSNWCRDVEGTFDVIISNPPYISIKALNTLAPEVVEYEPHLALQAGEDGLDAYRLLVPQLRKVLKDTGSVFLEIGENQEHEVAGLLEKCGFKDISYYKDLTGIVRVVHALV